jgi:hypothetical protein
MVAREWKIYGDEEVKFKKGRNEVDRTVAGNNTSKAAIWEVENMVELRGSYTVPIPYHGYILWDLRWFCRVDRGYR